MTVNGTLKKKEKLLSLSAHGFAFLEPSCPRRGLSLFINARHEIVDSSFICSLDSLTFLGCKRMS